MQEATKLLIPNIHLTVDHMFVREGDFVAKIYRRKTDGLHGVWAERSCNILTDSGYTPVKTLGKYSCYQHRNNQGSVSADIIKQVDEYFAGIEQLSWAYRKSYYIYR